MANINNKCNTNQVKNNLISSLLVDKNINNDNLICLEQKINDKAKMITTAINQNKELPSLSIKNMLDEIVNRVYKIIKYKTHYNTIVYEEEVFGSLTNSILNYLSEVNCESSMELKETKVKNKKSLSIHKIKQVIDNSNLTREFLQEYGTEVSLNKIYKFRFNTNEEKYEGESIKESSRRAENLDDINLDHVKFLSNNEKLR